MAGKKRPTGAPLQPPPLLPLPGLAAATNEALREAIANTETRTQELRRLYDNAQLLQSDANLDALRDCLIENADFLLDGAEAAIRLEAEVERLNALIERGAEQLTGFMGRCIKAEAALRDYDGELDAISRIVTDGPDTVDARHMAEQDLPIIRKRHAEALSLAGL